MRSLFHSRTPDTPPAVELARTVFPEMDGAQMAAVFAGERIGGDFFDAVRVSPERVLFGLLDVSGRRDTTQPILSKAQEVFRKFAAEAFGHPDINESETMTQLSLLLNRTIMEAAGGVRPCPAFIGCYHEHFGTLCYSNAGHTPGLLRDSTGITELAATGLPLGLFSHATADAPTVGLGKGSALLLLSRGVLDSKCKTHKGDKPEFGLDRTKEHFQHDYSTTATDLCTSMLKAVNEFTCEPPVHDDLTCLALIRSA